MRSRARWGWALPQPVEQQVRRTVDELPYLARGWFAVQLRRAGKQEEEAVWESGCRFDHRHVE